MKPGPDVEQHGHLPRSPVVGDDAQDLRVLAHRVADAVDVGIRLDRMEGCVDGGLVALVGEPAVVDVQDEWARAVLLWRELLGQQIEGCLAIRAWKGERVVGLRPERLHRSDREDDQHEPYAHDEHSMPRAEPSEAIEQPGHLPLPPSSPCDVRRLHRRIGGDFPRGQTVAVRDGRPHVLQRTQRTDEGRASSRSSGIERAAAVADAVRSLVELLERSPNAGELRRERVGLTHPFDAADRLARPFSDALAEPDRRGGIARDRGQTCELGLERRHARPRATLRSASRSRLTCPRLRRRRSARGGRAARRRRPCPRDPAPRTA